MTKDSVLATRTRIYDVACQEILIFHEKMKALFNNNDPLRKSLMGMYGELLFAKECEKNGLSVTHVGNLASYNFKINGHKTEVRTSELKHERAFRKIDKAWGWKLQTRDSQGRPKKLEWEYIVLVQLFDSWNKYKLYLFENEEVERMRTTMYAGYRNNARTIYLFKEGVEVALNLDPYKMITDECVIFNHDPDGHLLKWEIFRSPAL